MAGEGAGVGRSGASVGDRVAAGLAVAVAGEFVATAPRDGELAIDGDAAGAA